MNPVESFRPHFGWASSVNGTAPPEIIATYPCLEDVRQALRRVARGGEGRGRRMRVQARMDISP
jgi:hypothetical protein